MPNIVLGFVALTVPDTTSKEAGEIRLSDLSADEIVALQKPFDAIVTNHMPHDVSFPEIKGLFLRHSGDANGRQAMVRFSGFDDLKRLNASVYQIAALNKYAKAVTVAVDIPTDTGATEPDKAEKTEDDDSDDSAPGDDDDTVPGVVSDTVPGTGATGKRGGKKGT